MARSGDRSPATRKTYLHGGAFINHAAFTALEQLRWFQQSGNTFVEVNTTGTNAVDMRIQITGLATLYAGDFLL